jgi:hypothetical protein
MLAATKRQRIPTAAFSDDREGARCELASLATFNDHGFH